MATDQPTGDQGSDSVDPGWRPVIRAFLPTFLATFFLGGLGAFNQGGRDGLTVLRSLFLSLLSSGVLIAVVLFFIADRVSPDETWVIPAGVALSLLSIVVPNVVMRRTPEATDEGKFAGWYRTSFFLAFALCEVWYLIAFVLCFMVDAMLPILIALPGFVVGMLSIGPTRRNLENLQRRVAATGSAIGVVAALKNAPPPARAKRS